MHKKSVLHSPSPSSLCLGLLLCAAAVSTEAQAGPGSIYITDHKVNPAASNFVRELKAENKAALLRDPDSASWKVYFVANLTKAAGAEDVNIVFYDLKDKADKGKKPQPGQDLEPVQAYPIRVKPTAKVLMSEVDLKPEEGFKPGGKYQVLITRLVNGKEDVYARTTLELKDTEEGKKARDYKAPNSETPGAFPKEVSQEAEQREAAKAAAKKEALKKEAAEREAARKAAMREADKALGLTN
jgi:hypothetical protein